MSVIQTDLYRALKSSAIHKKRENRDKAFTDNDGAGSLHPRDGIDVTTHFDGNGVEWVRGINEMEDSENPFVQDHEGISVSATVGNFDYKGTCYFLLPKDTEVPAGLDTKKTPTDKDQEHYSIRCLNPMTLTAFKGALDTLARAAIVKAIEIGRNSLYHSA